MKYHLNYATWVRACLTLLLTLMMLALWVPAAHAQNYRAGLGGPNGRVFPDAAFRGVFTVVKYPYVELDGKRERMMPGTRLIDTHNRIITPASVTGKRLVVNYVRFANGQLHTIWVLTPQEMRERRRVADPSWWEKLRDNLGTWIDVAKWLAL